MGTRDGHLSILRVFFGQLPSTELVEAFVHIVDKITEDDDIALKEYTHFVVTYVHARDFFAGRTTLEGVSEEHRKEVFAKALRMHLEIVGEEADGYAIEALWKDYCEWRKQDKNVARPFQDWLGSLNR